MKSIITFFIAACLSGIVLMSCSRDAAWHLQKAKDKNPSLFEVHPPDTIIREIPVVKTVVDCDSIPEDGLALLLAVEDGSEDSVRIEFRTRWKPLTKADSLKIANGTLTKEDSLRIGKELDIEVDCPDSKEIIVDRPVPTPVPPTFWDKVQWVAIGAVGIGILLFLFLILRRFKVI